jgi:2-polyprenyl-3-methyl-5-hydroxy-6-metoxy-1,4-benzoquinol methylase
MFKQRSHTKELLDSHTLSMEDLSQNLRELHTINKWLGGYSITYKAMNKVVPPDSPAIVMDIGCGGGDTINGLHKWSLKKNRSVQLNGIDILPGCISYAQTNTIGKTGIRFICDDYRSSTTHIPKIDVMHASLFCHHLNNDEIVELIRFALVNKITLVINDLERHPVAYYSIKALTRIFSRSHLVKNDAPLSVLRGFKKREWIDLIKRAGAKKYTVTNRWAFRHEVIVYE